MHSFKSVFAIVALAMSTAAVPITHVRLLPLGKPHVVQGRDVSLPGLHDTPAMHAPIKIGSRDIVPSALSNSVPALPLPNLPNVPNVPSVPALGQPVTLPAVSVPAPGANAPAVPAPAPVPAEGAPSAPSAPSEAVPAPNAPAAPQTQVPTTLPDLLAGVKDQVTGLKSQLDNVAGGDVAAVVKVVVQLKEILVKAVADVRGVTVNVNVVVDLGKLVAEVLALVAQVLALVLKIVGSVEHGDLASLIHDVGTVVAELLGALLAKAGDLLHVANLLPVVGDVVPTLKSLGWTDVLKALDA